MPGTKGAHLLGGAEGPGIRRGLPLDVAATQMARACGPHGSSAEYRHNAVRSLEEHGIWSRNL
ncbi:hypothetical protein [Rubellimicrobium roseum]|uniref:hypothetical protein n=1 Tax=Rubellimicrobium roseum TaxID=687525 RepID=UPI00159B8CF3|nr:hypothetical protein [Rubellimicrobium roseum]